MKIEILGMGCAKCAALVANVEAVVKELGISAEVVKVSDLATIANYGVMMTPALVVDGTVKSTGKALKREEIRKVLQDAQQ